MINSGIKEIDQKVGPLEKGGLYLLFKDYQRDLYYRYIKQALDNNNKVLIFAETFPYYDFYYNETEIEHGLRELKCSNLHNLSLFESMEDDDLDCIKLDDFSLNKLEKHLQKYHYDFLIIEDFNFLYETDNFDSHVTLPITLNRCLSISKKYNVPILLCVELGPISLSTINNDIFEKPDLLFTHGIKSVIKAKYLESENKTENRNYYLEFDVHSEDNSISNYKYLINDINHDLVYMDSFVGDLFNTALSLGFLEKDAALYAINGKERKDKENA